VNALDSVGVAVVGTFLGEDGDCVIVKISG